MLASAYFQQSLDVVKEIAEQVQALALPEAAPDPHSFQFGSQWRFKDVADSRFVQASVDSIHEHLALAAGLELPEFTDYKFMGFAVNPPIG